MVSFIAPTQTFPQVMSPGFANTVQDTTSVGRSAPFGTRKSALAARPAGGHQNVSFTRQFHHLFPSLLASRLQVK